MSTLLLVNVQDACIRVWIYFWTYMYCQKLSSAVICPFKGCLPRPAPARTHPACPSYLTR